MAKLKEIEQFDEKEYNKVPIVEQDETKEEVKFNRDLTDTQTKFTNWLSALLILFYFVMLIVFSV